MAQLSLSFSLYNCVYCALQGRAPIRSLSGRAMLELIAG